VSDIVNNQRKIQGDTSSPTTLAVTFVESNGNAKNYATKLDPVALAVPGTSSAQGKDIKILDANGDTQAMWKENYKTSISEVELWTKNQLQLNRPVMLIVVAGDDGYNVINDLPGGSEEETTDNTDEIHKVEVTNITKDGVKEINGNFGINPLIYSSWVYWNGSYSKAVATYYSSTAYFEGGIDNAAGRHIIIDDQGRWNVVFVRKNTSTGYNEAILKMSSDGGRTWSESVIYSVAHDQYQAQITVDKLGTRHIVWVERRTEVCPPGAGEPDTNEYDIKYRNINCADEWSAVTVVSRSDTIYVGYQFMPSIQVKPDGTTIGVLWAGHYQLAEYSGLYRERSGDGTWGSEEIAIEYDFFDEVDRLTFDYDSDGEPNACYTVWSGSVFWRPRTTGSWGTATEIATGFDIRNISNLVIDHVGNQHLLHTDRTDIGLKLHKLYYQKKVGSGAWSERTEIMSSAYQNSQIQIDYELNIYIYTTYWNGSYWEGAMIKLTPELALDELISLQLTTDIVSIATPTSRLPKSGAMWTQMAKQWGCVVLGRASNTAWTDGDLLFTASTIAIIGTVDIPNKHDTYTTRIRGVIGTQKIQKMMIQPAMIG